MSKLSDMQARIAELEAALAAANTKIETLEHAKPARTKAPTKAQRKAQAEAEKAAMTSHLTPEELQAIAKSDASNPYASLASVAPKPTRKSAHGMKPYSQWKERTHLSAQQVLEIVGLYNEGVSKAEIARRFNVHPAYIRAILSGEQWSKVTGIVKDH